MINVVEPTAKLHVSLGRPCFLHTYKVFIYFQLTDKKHAKLCIKSLKNFVKPLEFVLESERNIHHNCPNKKHNLTETINRLLKVLKASISNVRIYVSDENNNVKKLLIGIT